MNSITTDQLLVLVGFAGGLVGVYVAMNIKIKSLEIKVEQLQKDSDQHRHEATKLDEKVTKKFDAIMEKFEEKFGLLNDKINEVIIEFTKR